MNNTMDISAYIWRHVIWSFLVFLWFKNLLFRCMPKCTYTESLVAFAVISVSVMTVGIMISWKKNRNFLNVIENIVLSWGVFVCITYMEFYKERILYSLLIVAIITLILSMFVLFRKTNRKGKSKRRKVMIRRIENVVALCKRNSALAVLIIMVSITISTLLYGTVLNSKVEVVKVYGDEHSLNANIEVIADIEPSRWAELDVQQKLNVCQKIVNVEARYTGLSHEILLGTDELSDGTLAYYKESTHQIVIDIDHLDSYSYEVLATLIHEVHHAYQYELVKLYQKLDEEERNLLLFYDASIYMEEFADYEDGSEDFGAYYMQLSEIDARIAAETESLVYIEAINDYLGKDDVDMNNFSCLQEYIDYISRD